MKSFIAACGLAAVLWPAVAAAGPIDDYIAAEDGYRAALAKDVEAGKSDDDLASADSTAIADLKSRLEAVLGNGPIAGLSGPDILPGSLQDGYIESYGVDGLLYANDDLTRTYFVTTEALVDHWRQWIAKSEDESAIYSQGLAATLTSDDIITASVSSDAAFTGFADLDLPEAKGDGVLRLVVGLTAQDIADLPPPQTLAVVRKGEDGRIAIASVLLKTTIKPIAACAKFKQQWLAENADANADPDVSIAKAQKLMAAYSSCFASNLPKQPYYAALTGEARSLLAFVKAPR
jgi:hypothetical protein